MLDDKEALSEKDVVTVFVSDFVLEIVPDDVPDSDTDSLSVLDLEAVPETDSLFDVEPVELCDEVKDRVADSEMLCD